MVDQGNIAVGMSADAVYLAWGKPNAVWQGEDGKTRTERWTYTRTTPVWSNQFNVGYGGGLRRYPYRNYYGYGGFYDYGQNGHLCSLCRRYCPFHQWAGFQVGRWRSLTRAPK